MGGGEPAPPPVVARANLALVMTFSWLFLTPLCVFWGAVWGPTRPASYPAGRLAPSPLAFVAKRLNVRTPSVSRTRSVPWPVAAR